MITPSNDPGLLSNRSNALGSPFVLAIKRAGIPVLPTIINAALLTSAWSAASSDLYTSSRALYGLAIAGQAPKIFARTTKRGLPYVSVSCAPVSERFVVEADSGQLILCSLFGGLAYMSLSKGAAQVFNWLANLTSCAGLLTWAGICFTYIRFHAGMKAQGIDRKKLPYYSILNHNAIGAKVALCFISVFLLFSGWTAFRGVFDAPGFVTNYRESRGRSRRINELTSYSSAPHDFPHPHRRCQDHQQVALCPCVRDGLYLGHCRDRGRGLASEQADDADRQVLGRVDVSAVEFISESLYRLDGLLYTKRATCMFAHESCIAV